MGAPHRPAILKWLSKLEEVLGALLVLLIFILLTIQVFQRYLPVATQPWIGEVSRYALMSLGFILVGSLMGQGRHLSIEAIMNVGRPAFKRSVVVISSIISAVICAVLAQDSWALISSDTGQTLQVTGFPMWILYVIPFVAFVSGTIQALANIVWAPSENIETLEDEALRAASDASAYASAEALDEESQK
ncbi:C4-dicarboxylate ABC transporter permease [Corynebacterium ammoniagenes DSM 20306]|nr:C4-dicarboxylate ABC transporter permease [Corynebacterium ammoniagenes DSM 20306]AQS74722.1 C4-dicarboxylate ABC transporter permease [Corynebacterium ammoniagenes]EFG80453.1 TRAP transporter, DctQ-like membrane protein [Corynebacterium ammoniagenes DSM 20306]